MTDVPRTIDDYTAEDLDLVCSGCLTVANNLQGLMSDIVISGGYVPSLLFDLAESNETGVSEETKELDEHIGTKDLDLGFSVALLDEDRYSAIAHQLRHARFEPDTNDTGNETPQRWRSEEHPALKLDFLISPESLEDSPEGGTIQHLEGDFAATVIPGLELAFEKPEVVTIEGHTLRGARTTEDIQVCQPAVFIILKSLAIERRGKDKDAYDLYYTLQKMYDRERRTAAVGIAQFLHDGSRDADDAIEYLAKHFDSPDSTGPFAVSDFLRRDTDDTILADASAVVLDFVRDVREAADHD